MIAEILKNMNLFIDGRGYAGVSDELTPPKLTMKTDEYRGGGMDAPVDLEVGMEKLEANYTLSKYDSDVLKQFGLAPGNLVPHTFRGAIETEDGTVKAAVINLRGMLKEQDMGTWKPGERATLKGTIAVRYYKLTLDGEVIHEIDVENMIRIIGGVDQLAEQRTALGM
jgi:P2 family phage contractile tail tube protein